MVTYLDNGHILNNAEPYQTKLKHNQTKPYQTKLHWNWHNSDIFEAMSSKFCMVPYLANGQMPNDAEPYQTKPNQIKPYQTR